ncbi:MAG TPA: hypothetical protein VFU43_04400 [Streptosporangiaceae bacterium]|nr:hypothetical protein [Streptosporangiaceae bacterium]
MTAPAVPTRVGRSVLLRRWPTWLGVALIVPLVATGLLTEFAEGIVVSAVIYWIWGAVRGQLWRPGWLTLETAGVAGFGAVTLAALSMNPGPARYLLAAGWLAHAGWDIAHHRADRIVPRWYAECCAVVDVLLAAAIVVLPAS